VKLKQTQQCPFNSVQVKIREVSPKGIRVTMEEKSEFYYKTIYKYFYGLYVLLSS